MRKKSTALPKKQKKKENISLKLLEMANESQEQLLKNFTKKSDRRSNLDEEGFFEPEEQTTGLNLYFLAKILLTMLILYQIVSIIGRSTLSEYGNLSQQWSNETRESTIPESEHMIFTVKLAKVSSAVEQTKIFEDKMVTLKQDMRKSFLVNLTVPQVG